MKLEDQLDRLASLGFSLDPGVSIDDLLYSFDREIYEEKPFHLILYALGFEIEREPWGRPFCSRVWSFDTECINGPGDYVKIAKRFCDVAEKPNALTDIKDHVDLENGEAWLEYKIEGELRHLKAKVDNDWADTDVINKVLTDLLYSPSDGRCFYAIDNGQAIILYYIDQETVKTLRELSGIEIRSLLTT